MSEINIDIEALVVEGFSHIEAYKIKQALETELTFLLQHHGPMNLGPEGIHLDQLKLGTIHLPSDQNTTRVGQRIAGAVFQQIHQLSIPASNHPLT